MPRSSNRFDRRESSRVDESGGVVGVVGVLQRQVARVGVTSAEKSRLTVLLPVHLFNRVNPICQ